MRFASASEVPGVNVMPITSEPSLKAGRKARGKKGTEATATSTSTAAAPSTGRVRASDQWSSAVSQAFRRRTIGLSPRCRRFIFGSR